MEQKFVVANAYHTPMTDDKYDGYVQITSVDTKLIKLIVENPTGSTRWIQIYDAQNDIDSNSVPMVSLKLLTVTQTTFDADQLNGLFCKDGLIIAVSSTGPTYTAVTAASDEGAFLSVFWL